MSRGLGSGSGAGAAQWVLTSLAKHPQTPAPWVWANRRWKNKTEKAEWCFKQQAVVCLFFFFSFFSFFSFFFGLFFVFFFFNPLFR